MRKCLSIVLVLVLLCGFLPITASAASNTRGDSAYSLEYDDSEMCVFCRICNPNKDPFGVQGKVIDTWVTWDYYYTYLWQTFQCPVCGYTWNSCMGKAENIHSASEDNPKTALNGRLRLHNGVWVLA